MTIERRRQGTRGEGLRRENPNLRWGDVPYSVAPYVPTPISVVRSMLKLAKVEPEDIVYDLGCGDGRILFTAVDEFQAMGAVGYDINPSICDPVRSRIEKRGMAGRIKIVNGNFFLADLSPASVVTLYLTTSGNTKLRPKLEEELREGARVVSHDFPIHEWTTIKPDPPEHYTLGSHKIYVYRIPDALERKKQIQRSSEEESSWKRIKDIFLRGEPR
jgi:ubiquinone/menaquinone biosynthesis C-methylase UbiE